MALGGEGSRIGRYSAPAVPFVGVLGPAGLLQQPLAAEWPWGRFPFISLAAFPGG